MGEALRTIFFVLLFSLIMVLQMNMDADKTATRQMKNAIELAVHDAALAIDPSQLNNGKIVFDQSRALNNLKGSLEQNLKVTSPGGGFLYTPNLNSFFKEDLILENFIVIDDNTHSFPYVYEDTKYNLDEILEGPSIIAIISTKSPRYFRGEPIIIRQAAIYEYQ